MDEAEEEEQLPPPPPPPLPPRTGPRCGPWQRRLNEIPVISFDVNCSVADYVVFMTLRFTRAGLLAPFSYCGAPVTPHKNPRAREKKGGKEIDDSGVFYHIIELFNSLEEDDRSLRVQLLVSDYDGYMVAIRRRVLNTWGAWGRFNHLYVPSWLNSEDMGVDASHNKKTTVGGSPLMQSMFYALVRPNRSKDEIRKAALRAIVIFIEAFRLSCILRLVMGAMRTGKETPLEPYHWERINSWGHLCKFTLQRAKYGQVESPNVLERMMNTCNYTSFDEIIGENGDLTWLMRDEGTLLDDELKRWLLRRGAGTDIANPDFDAAAAAVAPDDGQHEDDD
ncbi:uncharacterized protein [Triticum aestivum]|uniref:uncharacterized protein n=1 Tax=Triticum aestivum TaxID=4565 RepID=UPI0008450F53|nr:uncharacterized protein LOC123164142 [Triticum aestivum]